MELVAIPRLQGRVEGILVISFWLPRGVDKEFYTTAKLAWIMGGVLLPFVGRVSRVDVPLPWIS